jgi:hypothetical protein
MMRLENWNRTLNANPNAARSSLFDDADHHRADPTSHDWWASNAQHLSPSTPRAVSSRHRECERRRRRGRVDARALGGNPPDGPGEPVGRETALVSTLEHRHHGRVSRRRADAGFPRHRRVRGRRHGGVRGGRERVVVGVSSRRSEGVRGGRGED